MDELKAHFHSEAWDGIFIASNPYNLDMGHR